MDPSESSEIRKTACATEFCRSESRRAEYDQAYKTSVSYSVVSGRRKPIV